ncbi:hypothetical protein VKT23_018459 [Stygiomarasmius scandens]|uniref:Uncharacterized protein n=1 Tax=Marasmiellus scandens TaxID=2682957 RepID=A0ABR1IQH9_9AGAR
MPRTKTHNSKHQRKLANRAKSKKHYERNKDSINAKRRQKYHQQQKVAAEAAVIERKRKRERYWEQEALKQKEPTGSGSCPITGIRGIQQALNQATSYTPSSYLEKIYHEYQQWIHGQLETQPPISVALKKFEALFDSSKPFTNLILQQYGYDSEYSEAARIQNRVQKMIGCLEDMELAQMECRLELSYKLGRLLFQDQATVNYIDG